jgi:chemosensory pili system protein ChpA (sensor histidine kinase/response regulator)
MAKIDGSELLQLFFLEAEEHISTLNKGIPELEISPENDALMEEIFRAAHTLKGSAALVKLTVVSNIAHRMEDVLEGLKNRKIKVSSNMVDALLYMLDAITDQIQDVSEGRGERQEMERQVLKKVDEFFEKEKIGAPPAAVPSPRAGIVERREMPGRRREDVDFFVGNFVKIDIRKIEEMLNLIGEVTIMKNYLTQKTKEATAISDEIFFAGQRLLKEVTSFTERYSYSLPDNVKFIDPLFSEFGELEFDRYDERNLFSRKLQEITDDITEALKEFSHLYESLFENMKTMDNLIRLLRFDISDTRMIEIGKLLQRFGRPIKDMAKKYGKKVELRITGSNTKIDRVIFEKLFDPLMHMVRNAVYHGIEKPDERLLKGKRQEGLVVLSARRESNTIIIEIKDDGRGIDTSRLFRVAVKKGLYNADEEISREELISLIFRPGFSTIEVADMTSGRGIGMNAVRREVADINGVIEVESEDDSGTTFRLKVPSSMVISNVIVFSYANMEFVMPTGLIEEIIQFDPADVGDTGEELPHGMINYRGKAIYAKSLSEMFDTSMNADNLNKFVIVCNISDKKVGLIVNEILGQEETIIKSVNYFIEGLEIYSGVTISGDGKVRLVLNPIRIFEEEIQPLAVAHLKPVKDYTGRRVLIVDDSLSVRKYVSAFLEEKEFKAYSASNGVEALQFLEETPVDLVITDLEMPLMHGYELINRMNGIERLKKIPIVVLTSRGTEKHKERAFELGAEDYLVKPFEEKSLLEVLRKFLLLPHLA